MNGTTCGSASSALRLSAKRCALRRWRACAAAQQDNTRGTIRRVAGREYVRNIVERFSLQKIFADEKTVDALARAGYRGQGPLNTFVFLRFVTPFALFILHFGYLSLTVFADKPLYINAIYAVFIGLDWRISADALLKNRTVKRQQSIKRAWPDALDLMLLCVEAGMSVEHAFKRVAKEIGLQSAELAEEITLTTAELGFLEDRTRPTTISHAVPASMSSSR